MPEFYRPAWNPYDEGENPVCEICKERSGWDTAFYYDLRGAMLGCSDCIQELEDGSLADAASSFEFVVGPGEWQKTVVALAG